MKTSSPPSDRVHDYQFERVLGRGACGLVHLALDERSGQRCAVKEFPMTPSSSQQFYRELSTLFTVDHPNIVRCLDLVHRTEARRSYLVFEYANAGSLRDELNRRGTLSVDEALDVVRQVALGLQHAHGQQIVHRDLKPENILVHRDGATVTYKISDLGIARHLANGRDRSVSVGSPAYMAPEQFYDDATPASDFYALGIVLHEMLLGRTPFEDAPGRLWAAHLKQAVDLSGITDDGCRALLEWLLAKSPHLRPSCAGDILARLAVVDAARVAAPSPEPPRRLEGRLRAVEMRRREVPGGRGLHVLDAARAACLFVSDGRATDVYDVERDYLLPRCLGECVVASSSSWFASHAAVHTYATDTRQVRTLFPHRTRVEAMAVLEEARAVVYADALRVCCSNDVGELLWSDRCPSYFVQPQLAVLPSGLVVASSGPLRPTVHAWSAGGERAWQVALEAPVLALWPGRESERFTVVTMGLGADEPGRWLRFDGPTLLDQGTIASDVYDARAHGDFVTLHHVARGDGERSVSLVDADSGAPHDEVLVEGTVLGEAWLPRLGVFAILARADRRTWLHLYEVEGVPQCATT